jgi:hypothetical protein
MGKVPAQVVGEEIALLENENDGALSLETVVRSAKRKKSPIHDCFEWDDVAAGKKYRVQQAREMLRKIVVVYEDTGGKTEEIRAFVCVQHEDENYYTSTARIVEDEELQENVLAQILAELLATKKKYAQFKSPKLQAIWDAVDACCVS